MERRSILCDLGQLFIDLGEPSGINARQRFVFGKIIDKQLDGGAVLARGSVAFMTPAVDKVFGLADIAGYKITRHFIGEFLDDGIAANTVTQKLNLCGILRIPFGKFFVKI
ncbi:hypothetical protein BJF79_30905 [Actinomadura sp. CNU-125]|nr:hypothetical protein BJF79_30905 [Actinomadura sp. CNU-125]